MAPFLTLVLHSWVASSSRVRGVVKRVICSGLSDDQRLADIALARDAQALLGLLVSIVVTWNQLSLGAWRSAYAFVLSPFTNTIIALSVIVTAGTTLMLVAPATQRSDIRAGLLGSVFRGLVAVGASLLGLRVLVALKNSDVDFTSIGGLIGSLTVAVFVVWVLLPALWTIAESTVASRFGASQAHPLLGPLLSIAIAAFAALSKYVDWRGHPSTALSGPWSAVMLLGGPAVILGIAVWEVKRVMQLLGLARFRDLALSRF